MIFRFFFLREIEKYPFFFILVLFTILLGSVGLNGISLVASEVKEKLSSRSKELLTSDLAVSARRDLNPDEKKKLDELMRRYPHKSYQVIDIYSMITHLKTGQGRLVEVRAVQDGFPFYGSITTRKNSSDNQGIKISKDLEGLWSIGPQDEIQLGDIVIPVIDVIEEDSSVGLRGFSLAPRIYAPLELLHKTNLLRPGVTGSFSYHFLLPNQSDEDIKKIKDALYEVLKDPAIKINLPQDSSRQMGRVINVLTNFMSLSALIGLILSLVGVFYLYQSHLLARLKDLCLLNLHGLSKKAILGGIIGQFSVIFIFVFLIELLILFPLYNNLLPSLSQSLGMDLMNSFNYKSILSELPFLYILSLSILIPLFLGLLRTPMGIMLKAPKMSMGRFRFYDFTPFIILLWFFSCYLSQSFKIGNIFFIALFSVFLVSTLIVRSFQWGLKKIIQDKGLLLPILESGIALRNLSRSGHKLTLSFLSLSLGATLISLILQLDVMIDKEFSIDEARPGLFLFDIQEEQLESLLDFAKKNETPLGAITPMIRGRLERVNGKKFKPSQKLRFQDSEEQRERRERSNALNLTSRQELSPSEKIVDGEDFPQEIGQREWAYVSLEKRWADRAGLNLGDMLTFDIQGVPLEAKVRSLREVKWTSFYPNFFINIEPGFLEGAPKTYLAILPAGYKSLKHDFQRKAVSAFPNISFIDVEELVGKLAVLIEKSQKAIGLISFLSLIVGLVILYGLSHDQVLRRYYDLALMKGLGLSAHRVRGLLLIEFGTLFSLALTVGLFLGWIIAQVIGKEVFKLPIMISWERIFIPGLGLGLLCLVTIILSSWRVVNMRPRELLSDT